MRVGLHSSLAAEDVATDRLGNVRFGGTALRTAKLLADCGHGGMVLLSHACLGALVPSTRISREFGGMLFLGEFTFDVGSDAQNTFSSSAQQDAAVAHAVYMALPRELQPRLAVLADRPLRNVTMALAGALQAPISHATVVFVNVVGASTLMAWNAKVASGAFDVLHQHAQRLLLDKGGGGAALSESRALASSASRDGGLEPQACVVKMVGGLCVVAFHSAATALAWALKLVDELRLVAEWNAELLAHEMCEEVLVPAGLASRAAPRTSNTRARARSELPAPTPAGANKPQRSHMPQRQPRHLRHAADEAESPGGGRQNKQRRARRMSVWNATGAGA